MLRLGATRTMAATYARCHPATIRAEMRRDPSFANQIAQSELRSETSFLKVIHAAGKDPKQWRAAAWALERMYPERYARRKGNTLTEEQVQQLVAEMAEIVASELPITKYRQRIFNRLADLQTNYKSHIGAERHAADSTKAGRKPIRRIRRNVPPVPQDGAGTNNQRNRSGDA